MNILLNVFQDASLIFVAVLLPQGSARMLLRLGESGLVHLWIGKQVLRECESVVRRKSAHSLPELALLLETAVVRIGSIASPDNFERAKRLVVYSPDALGLAEAIETHPDWFLTHDQLHFLHLPPAEVPFQIGSHSDFLTWLRERMIKLS